MGLAQLLRWQWDGYARYHRSRANLLVHIVAVPLFLAANVGLVVTSLHRSILRASLSLLFIAASVVLQGRGHAMEENPPEPFTGPGNAVARIFLEQWVTFPRFLLSGGWLRALRSPAPGVSR